MGKLNPEYEELFSEGILNRLCLILEKIDITVNSKRYLEYINNKN